VRRLEAGAAVARIAMFARSWASRTARVQQKARELELPSTNRFSKGVRCALLHLELTPLGAHEAISTLVQRSELDAEFRELAWHTFRSLHVNHFKQDEARPVLRKQPPSLMLRIRMQKLVI
jgi:hypothetical protein